MSLKLNCLIAGEDIVFSVTAVCNDRVMDLKESIHSNREKDSLQDVDPHTLELWKVKDSNSIAAEPDDTLAERIGLLGHDLSNFAVELEAVDSAFSIFPTQPPGYCIHIIVKVPRTIGKRKRNNPTDVSQKLFKLWTTPVELDLKFLKGYLESPLDPDWKIPLSHAEWTKFLISEELPDHACSDEDLELLFKQCEDETADPIRELLRPAIVRSPLDAEGTEASLHVFWDTNIRNILVGCLNGESIRNSNQGTDTGSFRPNFGLLLADVCVFRGEEKRKVFTGRHPKDELQNKTRWVYGPAPYVLGYWAVGVRVGLAAILPHDGRLRVIDLIIADLSSRRERIKNASRMIKLCGILRWLQQRIGEGKDRDMFLQFREGGKSILFFTSYVRKTYGLEDPANGKERVEHLMKIYQALESKRIPNVDLLRKAAVQHDVLGSYIECGPVGNDKGPISSVDVQNAIMCILETLKVSHAHPQTLLHRDIRWPNVMQNREQPSNWFLIDWEEACFLPSKAAPHLNPVEHSPKVFKDNHGTEVDIWSVGRLIFTAPFRVQALEELGRRMMEGHILNAEQGLKEISQLKLTL